MQDISVDKLPPEIISTDNAAKKFYDFRHLLNEFGLAFTEKDFYLQVGEIKQVEGWIIHLSVIRLQMLDLFNRLIPELAAGDIPFKIIRDSETARYILDATLGYEKLGKIMAVYPKEGTDIVALAQRLITLTAQFKGPIIPTDRRLGGIVYTRFGGYNPVIGADDPAKIPYIHNGRGELVPDTYSIPFQPAADSIWPFESIAPVLPPASRKLWKDKYKPLLILKDDTKGRVLKGIYMKGFLNIKHCIIKEGKSNMWVDEFGRDIQDRLKWQYELCNDLSNDIPLPKIFDLFEEEENLYLAMEFISGESLEDVVTSCCNGDSWFTLPREKRLGLINYLSKIVAIIRKFHGRGYVHRDITPANFLIDKKDRIFLIDMELSYSVFRQQPDPPFKLGTYGYLSPEQRTHKVPAFAEDLYAIGGLMIFAFTGLPPLKFNVREFEPLLESLLFYTRSRFISEHIVRCLSRDPAERPSLEETSEILAKYAQEVKMETLPDSKLFGNNADAVTEDRVKYLVDKGLNGLLGDSLITEDLLWDSRVVLNNSLSQTANLERNYLSGLYNGMAGILYCISKAGLLGYDVSDLIPAYQSCWEYIKRKNYGEHLTLPGGLYGGGAGVALSIAQGLEAGLIVSDKEWTDCLERSFTNTGDGLSFSHGIAGEGVALLQCAKWLHPEFTRLQLTQHIDTILKAQLPDGTWHLEDAGNTGKQMIDIANGFPGIVYFLLDYVNVYPEERVITAVRKALNRLITMAISKNNMLCWKTAQPPGVRLFSRDLGQPGIIWLFIKAFRYFKAPEYKAAAEKALRFLPVCPTITDFSQSTGLAGLGEIYLEAYEVLGNPEWKRRAGWITNTYAHLFQMTTGGNNYWVMAYHPDPVADFMLGNCGVIHYLMKHQHKERINCFNLLHK